MNLTNDLYGNLQPTWAADGTLYFVSNRNGRDNIWALSPQPAGATRTIAADDTEPAEDTARTAMVPTD